MDEVKIIEIKKSSGSEHRRSWQHHLRLQEASHQSLQGRCVRQPEVLQRRYGSHRCSIICSKFLLASLLPFWAASVYQKMASSLSL